MAAHRVSDAALKDAARRLWASGDYPVVARTHAAAGDATARRAGAAPGVRLLDVGAGDGNVAIPAALAGADVVAVDLTPEMLAAGEQRARRTGARAVDWRLGDAEDLPVPDGAFDVVTSNFGAVFAPRHDVAARELARAVRPGGLVVLTAWTAAGIKGRMFAVIAAHLPPPPPGVGSPIDWGDEAHGREILEDARLDVEVEHDVVTSTWPSADAAHEFFATLFPPLVGHRARLEVDDRWEAAVADVCALWDAAAYPHADGVAIDGPYLRYVATRPA